MAKGSFNLARTSGTKYLQAKINWSSTPIAGQNASKVKADLILWRTNKGYTTRGTGTFSITIYGKMQTQKNIKYSFTDEETTIMSYELTVEHDSNGNRNVDIAGEYNGDTPISGEGSATCYLDELKAPETAQQSVFNTIGNLYIEDEHWFTFTWKDDSYEHDTWIQVKNINAPDKEGSWTTVLEKKNYHNGEKLRFSPGAITQIYKIAMPETAVGDIEDKIGGCVDVRYCLETYTPNHGKHIGDSFANVRGFIGGSAFVNFVGTWKACVPFINVVGTWKPCICYQNINGVWKQSYGKIHEI